MFSSKSEQNKWLRTLHHGLFFCCLLKRFYYIKNLNSIGLLSFLRLKRSIGILLVFSLRMEKDYFLKFFLRLEEDCWFSIGGFLSVFFTTRSLDVFFYWKYYSFTGYFDLKAKVSRIHVRTNCFCERRVFLVMRCV